MMMDFYLDFLINARLSVCLSVPFLVKDKACSAGSNLHVGKLFLCPLRGRKPHVSLVRYSPAARRRDAEGGHPPGWFGALQLAFPLGVTGSAGPALYAVVPALMPSNDMKVWSGYGGIAPAGDCTLASGAASVTC